LLKERHNQYLWAGYLQGWASDWRRLDREGYSATHATSRWKLGPRHSCSVPVGSMFDESANMLANKSTLASSSLKVKVSDRSLARRIKENRGKNDASFHERSLIFPMTMTLHENMRLDNFAFALRHSWNHNTLHCVTSCSVKLRTWHLIANIALNWIALLCTIFSTHLNTVYTTLH
jgi:hypothetical protein